MAGKRCVADTYRCKVSLGPFGICDGSREHHADTFVFRHRYDGRCNAAMVEGKHGPECEVGHAADAPAGL